MYLIEWKGKKKSNIRQREREMKSYWIVIIISVYHKRVLLTKLYSKRKQAAYIFLSAFCLFSHETSFLFASGKKSVAPAPVFFERAQEVNWVDFLSRLACIELRRSQNLAWSHFPYEHYYFFKFCPISFRQLLHLFNIFDEIYELKKLCENSCELP